MLSFPIIACSTEMYKQGLEYLNMEEQAKANYYFLLCKKCYWCASSVIFEASNRIIKCPGCNDYGCIKLMSIFENEPNRIDCSKNVNLRLNLELNTHLRMPS